jgi:hypothetical protein
MFTMMNDHYSSLKTQNGFDVGIDPHKDNAALDQVLSEMKPNSSAQNFR